jgi:hypothetical protein
MHQDVCFSFLRLTNNAEMFIFLLSCSMDLINSVWKDTIYSYTKLLYIITLLVLCVITIYTYVLQLSDLCRRMYLAPCV